MAKQASRKYKHDYKAKHIIMLDKNKLIHMYTYMAAQYSRSMYRSTQTKSSS